MQLKVIKFKLYPEVNPEGYAVGFNVKLLNGRGFYAHTIVNLDELSEGKTDVEIAQMAYMQLETHIADRIGSLTYVPKIEGIEINIDNEYEVRATEINDKVINLESGITNLEATVDTMLAFGEGDM